MKKKIVLFASMALSVGILTSVLPSGVSAKSVEQMEKEISGYQSQLNKLQSNGTNQKKYQDTLTAQISVLKQQMDAYQSQLDDINSKIQQKNNEISALDDQIDAQQAQIDSMNTEIATKESQKQDTADKLCARMKDDYMSGKTSSLEVLLSSNDFGSFISNLTYVKKIAANDKALTDELDRQISDINAVKSEQEAKVAALNQQKNQMLSVLNEVQNEANKANAAEDNLESVKNTLTQQLSKSQQTSAEINSAKAAVEKAKQNVEEQLEDATKEIQEAIDSGGGGGGGTPVDPSGYLFPVAQPCYISQPYKGSAHKGVDIATGGRPNPIYASRGGKVIVVMYNAPYGSGYGGYGNVVVIDHGDGYQTLYAHMSTISVSKGQVVDRGQQIGNVGNTGQSTGYHLHFELRQNGVPIRPPF